MGALVVMEPRAIMEIDDGIETPRPREGSAEAVFAEYLVRRERGEEVVLDRFCAEHPALADELESLVRVWNGLEEALGRRADPPELPAATPAPGEGGPRRWAEASTETPRYRVLGEHARGGMGAILRVWDSDLRRRLAMKVIRDEAGGGPGPDTPSTDPGLLARFLEEARITGQLDHPGIVPVHELGLDSRGRVYFTMRLVKGHDLDEVFSFVRTGERGWSQARALGVMLKVCEAVAFAHSKGVIHRDLKPSNVMVGEFGEVYAMDWGLAKVTGGGDGAVRGATPSTSPLSTRDGDVLGTPAFMSPEQARGEVEAVGPRSDVYSLGAMLYQLLTGRRPHVPAGGRVAPEEVLKSLLDGPPEPVADLAPEAPAELVAIVEKATAREAPDRYADMGELAADLRAFLENRVVRAHRTGVAARIHKWVQRNRALAATAVAAVAALLVLSSGGSVVLAGKNRDLREQTRVAEESAEEASRRQRDVQALSAFRSLEELVERAGPLWPAEPARIGELLRWIEDAERLLETLRGGEDGYPGHYEIRDRLEARARPRTAEGRRRDRERNPRYGELAPLRAKIDWLEYVGRVRRGEQDVEHVELDGETAGRPTGELMARAWEALRIDRTTFDGAPTALAIARLLGERDPECVGAATLLPLALLANGLVDEAVEVAGAAVELVGPEHRVKAQANADRLRSVDSPYRRQVSAAALPAARAQLVELERALEERLDWTFDEDVDTWWHGQIVELIDALEAFADDDRGLLGSGTDPQRGWGIRRRLAEARRLERGFAAGGELRLRWEEALPRIRAREGYPADLGIQTGLVPIGPDPRSKLWEFWHVLSGDEPARDPGTGELVLNDRSGMVFVLVPETAFWMGAQGDDPFGRNYERSAFGDESPVKEVRLSPYFISKYEMTQDQWERFTGANPSGYVLPEKGGGPLTPVEVVGWEQCVEVLRRLGLVLPTEAQWECAARGGTSTPWSCGATGESLAKAGNVADAWYGAHAPSPIHEPWSDGRLGHAAVGSLAANPFGLHDVHGNVWEWCREWKGSYALPTADGDGERAAPEDPELRVLRGGSFQDLAVPARSASRNGVRAEARNSNVGLRPARAVDR